MESYLIVAGRSWEGRSGRPCIGCCLRQNSAQDTDPSSLHKQPNTVVIAKIRSSVESQKGLIITHLHMRLDSFDYKLTQNYYISDYIDIITGTMSVQQEFSRASAMSRSALCLCLFVQGKNLCVGVSENKLCRYVYVFYIVFLGPTRISISLQFLQEQVFEGGPCLLNDVQTIYKSAAKQSRLCTHMYSIYHHCSRVLTECHMRYYTI